MLTTIPVGLLEELAVPIATQIVSQCPGRVRLKVAHPHRQGKTIGHVVRALESHPQVKGVQANVKTGSIVVHHERKEGGFEAIFAVLKDLGIIFSDIVPTDIPTRPSGQSDAAAGLTRAIADLNQRVNRTTKGVVDLRFLFPLGLALLAIRQLRTKGLQLDIVPWYVLAWYAFDSFMKLHYTRDTAPRASSQP
jgi:hypothetical protein